MSEESKILGVSIRGWLAILLTTTVCGMSILRVEVKEPLYTVIVMALSFYFGQKTAGSNGNQTGTGPK